MSMGKPAGRPGRPKRGRGKLSRERIAGAALALVEEEGAGAVSMRSVAKKLRVDPMALYTYFPGRSALIREIVEREFASVRVPGPAGDWRKSVGDFALAYARTAARWRSLVLSMIQDSELAEGLAKRWNSELAACLRAGGIRRNRIRPAIHALIDFLNGFALAGIFSPSALRAELAILLAGMESMREG